MDFSNNAGAAPDHSAGMSAEGWQAQPRPKSGQKDGPWLPAPLAAGHHRTLDQRIRVGVSDVALHDNYGHVNIKLLSDRDWKRQLSDFLHKYGREAQRGAKETVSEETFRNRQDQMFSTVRELMADQKLQHMVSLAQCTPRMLPVMFQKWTQRGVSKRAQINYYNTWRWFWRACGIEIPDIGHYATTTGEFTINRAATEDKSWAAKGIKIEEIAQRVAELDPIGARIILLMAGFGLRVKEGLRLRPHEADGGDRLHVTEGTKNGRPRTLNFKELGDSDYRAMLDRAKAEVDPKCHAAWSKRSLKQAKQRMYDLARKVGITKNQLGVTWHGLRHQYAIDLLESMSGAVAPVRGGNFTMLDYKQLSAIRKKISQALGHSRTKITGAYYGSFTGLNNQHMRNFEASWTLLCKALEPLASQILSTESVDNLYWIGVRAEGLSIDKNVPFHLVFAPGVEGRKFLGLGREIAASMTASLGVQCIVQAWDDLPATTRAKWEKLAVPIFRAEDPVRAFAANMRRQKTLPLG